MKNLYEFLNSQSDGRLILFGIIFIIVIISFTEMFAKIFKRKDK